MMVIIGAGRRQPPGGLYAPTASTDHSRIRGLMPPDSYDLRAVRLKRKRWVATP